MKKEVFNGPIMRVIRTIGYGSLLIGAFLLLLDALASYNINFISNYLVIIDDFITNNFQMSLYGLKYWLFLVGIIMLIFTLSKNIFLKTLTTLLLFITILNINMTGAIYFDNFKELLFSNESFLNKIVEFFNSTINKEVLIPLILNVLTPFFIYVIIASKKPGRIATKLVSSGLLLITFTIAFYSFPLISVIPFLQTTTYFNIVNGILASGLLSITVGSCFGVLGVFRK